MFRLFGMVRSDPYAFTAVNSPFGYYSRLAVADADCLGGAALDAVRASDAKLLYQHNRMKKTVHGISPPW